MNRGLTVADRNAIRDRLDSGVYEGPEAAEHAPDDVSALLGAVEYLSESEAYYMDRVARWEWAARDVFNALEAGHLTVNGEYGTYALAKLRELKP